MTEKELLVDCLQRLNRANIVYMLTGSMVSNFWGIPRTTHDLDFVVQLAEESSRRLLSEFSGDYHLDEAAMRAAREPPHQFNAIDLRSPLKVDFWLLQPDPFEQEMFSRRIETVLFAETAWICTAEDVVLHKLYWNSISPSDRQLGDAAGVVAVQGEDLDVSYMEQWAARLGVSDVLRSLLTGEIGPKQT
jgi:hypothetical protein